jgi:hypothetical protein
MKVLLFRMLAPKRVAALGGLIECQSCGRIGPTDTNIPHGIVCGCTLQRKRKLLKPSPDQVLSKPQYRFIDSSGQDRARSERQMPRSERRCSFAAREDPSVHLRSAPHEVRPSLFKNQAKCKAPSNHPDSPEAKGPHPLSLSGRPERRGCLALELHLAAEQRYPFHSTGESHA